MPVEFQPMSPEEIERTVQFLLNQQAQFAIDLEKLSGKTDRIAEGVIGLTAIVGQLASAQERTDQQLRETSRKLEETGRRLEEADARLTGHLIAMFEHHLRKDHGHEPS